MDAAPSFDTTEIRGNEVGAYAHYDNGRWRLFFESFSEWLPEGTNREQAEFIVNLLPKFFRSGYREGYDKAATEAQFARQAGRF